MAQVGQVSDVLSGYISNPIARVVTSPTCSTGTLTLATDQSRVVQTPRVIQTVSSVLSGYVTLSTSWDTDKQLDTSRVGVTSGTKSMIATPASDQTKDTSRVLTTNRALESEQIKPDVHAFELEDTSRVATTTDNFNELEPAELEDTSRVATTTDNVDELEQAEIDAAAARNTELHLLLDDDQDSTRVVVTENIEQAHPTFEKDKSEASVVELEKKAEQREQTELEVAETLLQLQSTDIDTEPDNDKILPVDAPKQDDFTKDMAEAEKSAHTGIGDNDQRQ